MALDLHIISNNIAALSGGITILSAHVTGEGAGTSWLQLVIAGAAGTALSGTIANAGTVVSVAGVPQALTISTGFVDEGYWVAAKENNVGTTNAISIWSLAYVMGKG
jgi:hypothetical protein